MKALVFITFLINVVEEKKLLSQGEQEHKERTLSYASEAAVKIHGRKTIYSRTECIPIYQRGSEHINNQSPELLNPLLEPDKGQLILVHEANQLHALYNEPSSSNH